MKFPLKIIFKSFLLINCLGISQVIFTQASGGVEEQLQKQAKAGQPISGNVLGEILAGMKIPQETFTLFKGLTITTPTVVAPPGELKDGVAIKGSTTFKGAKVDAEIIAGTDKKTGGPAYSIAIIVPELKPSAILSSLRKLDVLSLPNGQIIVSNFDYTEPTSEIEIKPGLNLIAELDLSGPLKVLNTLKNNAKKLKGLVFKAGKIHFEGVIPQDINQALISADIPLSFGVNFAQLPLPGKAGSAVKKAITQVIKEITFGDAEISVAPPPSLALTLGGGMGLQLATQREPLNFKVSGSATPEQIYKLTGQMQGPLELKWLTIEDVGLDVSWDTKLMTQLALVGIPLPFTGVGFTGWLYLGTKGDKKTGLHLAGGVRGQEGANPVQFGFDAQAKNMDFKTFVSFLAEKIAKKSIKAQVPQMKLENLAVKVSPTDSYWGGELIPSGITVDSDIDLFGIEGKTNFRLNPDALEIGGSGSLSPIAIKVGGKDVLKISGAGTDKKMGTQDDGAAMSFYFSPDITKSHFSLDGILQLPVLGIGAAIKDMSVGLDRIGGSFEGKVGGLFDVDFTMDVRLAKLLDSLINFSFKQDFANQLAREVTTELEVVKAQTLQQIASIDRAIASLNNRLGVANKAKQLKDKLDAKQNEFNKKCKGTKYAKNVGTCSKLSADITSLGIQWAAVKGTAEVVEGVTKIAEQINKQKVIKKTIEGTVGVIDQLAAAAIKGFNIKKAEGVWKVRDISPEITDLEIDINLPGYTKSLVLRGIKVDFKQPATIVKNVAKQIAANIKSAFKI